MKIEDVPGDTRRQFDEEHRDLTIAALVQVFEVHPHKATADVYKLWERFAHAPRGERDLLLHNDPLALACEIAEYNWNDIDQSRLAKFNETRRRQPEVLGQY